MSSPKKPWELNTSNSTISNTLPNTGATVAGISGATPEIPVRPTRPLSMGAYGANSGYNQYGMGGAGTYNSGYGMGGVNQYGVGGVSTYNSGYGTYGTGYTSNYGRPYGGYNSGYGSPYGGVGYNSYSGGYNRFNNRPGLEDPSMMQRMELSTQSTFQMLDQIVQTFGGFSQMLESTFFATHSSFMAMIGVADQFSQLRNYLGQVFSIMAVYQSVKRFVYRITRQVDVNAISADAFNNFNSGKPKPSKKPLFVFLSLVFGLPWLFSKLMKEVDKSKSLNAPSANVIANIEFCKAVYDFQSDQPGDLPFRSGDLIAVLSKVDPVTNAPSDWWKGRNQEGRIGIFPHNYVQILSQVNNSTIQPVVEPMKPSPFSAADFQSLTL